MLLPDYQNFSKVQYMVQSERHIVKIRPRKACRYPNLRSFGWVSYDKVGGSYSGKLGIRSEARASDLRSYPGLWWKRIKLHFYEETKVSTLRGPAQLADLQGALCVPHLLISHYYAGGIVVRTPGLTMDAKKQN